jgi:hypothetical protein
MTAITPETEAVLARAAELRAQGSGWIPVARELGREVPELRKLCADAGSTYTRLYEKARRATFAESLNEATFVLRNQIRSDNETAARRSAESLSRTALAFERDRFQRVKWRVGLAAKYPTDPEQFFPDTPAGRQARAAWERGKLELEGDALMTPEYEAQLRDILLKDICEERGCPVPVAKLPDPPPASDPDDDDPPDDGGSRVPREPAPPFDGGQWPVASGQCAKRGCQSSVVIPNRFEGLLFE